METKNQRGTQDRWNFNLEEKENRKKLELNSFICRLPRNWSWRNFFLTFFIKRKIREGEERLRKEKVRSRVGAKVGGRCCWMPMESLYNKNNNLIFFFFNNNNGENYFNNDSKLLIYEIKYIYKLDKSFNSFVF